MHLWCSKGIGPQAQGHERETCLSSFQHSLKRVLQLCRCFQTASQHCHPQVLMGQAALALGQWGPKSSRLGRGLTGRLLASLTAPHRICGGFLTQSMRAASLTFLCCQWTMLAVLREPVGTKARRLVDLNLALKTGRAPYMGCVVSLQCRIKNWGQRQAQMGKSMNIAWRGQRARAAGRLCH